MKLPCMVVWIAAAFIVSMRNQKVSCQKTEDEKKQNVDRTKQVQNQNMEPGETEMVSSDRALNAEYERVNTKKYVGDQSLNSSHSKSNKLIDIYMETTTTEGIPPGFLVMFMDSFRVFKVNYKLQCSNTHARYVLQVLLRQLSHHMTAALSSPVSVSISCEHAKRFHATESNYIIEEENDTKEKYDTEKEISNEDSIEDKDGTLFVSGTFNISVTANLLGRSILLFFLQSNNGEKPNTTGISGLQVDEILHNLKKESPNFTKPLSCFNPTPKDNSALRSYHKQQQQQYHRQLPKPVYQAELLVLRERGIVDVAFAVIICVFIVAATVAMGCKTELTVVKQVLKKPSAPIIGFFCQYVCMPLIAYGVTRSLQLDNSLVSFGIFACGVCPGGGASNVYTYLLGGDLSLSVTLTIISNVASLGMIPFWLFTLGATMSSGTATIKIPYTKIMETLAAIILPVFLGIFLQYRFPRVAQFFPKVMKPAFVVFLLLLLTVGIYANLYIFRLFEPMAILGGCLLPYIGYVVGGMISFICRQPWSRVKTIALETGIQNVGVAFLILIFSLPPPDGELSAVGPVVSVTMTGLPPLLLTIAYTIYNKVKGKPLPMQELEMEEEGGGKGD